MSTSSSHPCFSYDVFLSFRGVDTRTTFTDHLYAALNRAGLRTFRDDDAMDRGKLLGPELKKAIRQSAISIIIFSTNYASSKWCLDEVLSIIQEQERPNSRHEVVPVFYNVEPSDVRNQSGSFQAAFDGYEEMIEKETDDEKKIEWQEKVRGWRASLTKAGSFTGMVLANRPEATFISKIVGVIRKKLNYKLMYIDDKLVGMNYNVAVIESWSQDPSPDAVALFIHGMGGIGKTTISKCIYNSNHHEYDLLTTLLRSEKEEVIWNLDEGIIKVTNALHDNKVLLILDDITTRQQLIALLGPLEFYPRSKVIITTRDKGLLNAFKIPPNIHTINELGLTDSRELFSLYASDEDHLVEPYVCQSEVIVHLCGGLPLALKVLGVSLKGKTMDVWEDSMRKLEAIPNPVIQNILQLSYDTLDDTKDKDLFLHVACFFVGEDKEFIVQLLKHCDLYPVVGIQNLMDRSLLYIENGRVMMHQLIKEMAQEVVRQESPKNPGKRSRLWNHQDSYVVLKENSGTRKVEGLSLDMKKLKGNNLTSMVRMDRGIKRSYEDSSNSTTTADREDFNIGAVEKMKNLILLQLDYTTFSGSYKKLPKKLRLLRWHGLSLKSIPTDFPLDKLVVLDLRYSKLKQVWSGFKVVGSLKILNLSYSLELIKTPDFGGLPSLESLLLKGCLSLTNVCDSIGYLERLVLLDVTDCRSLKNIPYLPTSLVSLTMHGCINLGALPHVQRLDSCSVPYSLLVDIDVSACNLFDNSFTQDWSNLLSLKSLNINGNPITSLPGCIKSLPSLETLNASYCPNLQYVLDIPESICTLVLDSNLSLEILQPTSNPINYLYADDCRKLCEVEGCFKVESIKNVDRKIVRYLGLEYVLKNGLMDVGVENQNENAKDVPIKVSFEFGIFSTFLIGKHTLPCFGFKGYMPRVSFRVPSHRNGTRVIGLNVCCMSSTQFTRIFEYVEINNKTKNVVWKYTPTIHDVRCENRGKNYVWLSLWRIGNLLDDGDEIVVSINHLWGSYIEECCVNLVYEDDDDKTGEEDMNEERKDIDCVIDRISWNEMMLTEISNYVHCGITYWFNITGTPLSPYTTDEIFVDWWGVIPTEYARKTWVETGRLLRHSDLEEKK